MEPLGAQLRGRLGIVEAVAVNGSRNFESRMSVK